MAIGIVHRLDRVQQGLQGRLAQLDDCGGLAVVQQLLDGIAGIVDPTRPTRGLAVGHEIMNANSLLKRPPDNGNSGATA